MLAGLVLAAPALLVTVDSALAYARGWRFSSRFDLSGALAAAAWLLVVAVACLVPASRRRLAVKLPQLLALSLSVCAGWLASELALGPLLERIDNPYLSRPGLTRVYRPLPGMMRDVGPESHVRTNSWGMRGSDPPPRETAYRILCLGGSTTACTYLDDTKTWPALVESRMQSSASTEKPARFWVGNAGLPGLRSMENLRFLQQSQRVNEVDCVVVQTGVNDLISCLAGLRPAPPLWIRSHVWRMAHVIIRSSIESGTLVEDAAGDVYRRRRAIRQAAAISDDAPPLEPCLQNFADNIQAIIEVCRQHHVRAVFTTQPVLWRADLDAQNESLLWFGQLADGRFLSARMLRAAADQYNDTLRNVCASEGIGLIDLDELNGDPTAFYDDCHFTETGARRVAQLVAEWLLEHPDDARSGAES
ncbi:MAG: SGNH/GDSL hydrolase family protein [Pirellulales bacterium]